MAIVFQKQLKRQRTLIILFFVVLAVGGLVLWWNSREEETEKRIISLQRHRFQRIEIDLEVFKNPFLKESKPMGRIPEFEGSVGRENPFTSL